MKGKVVVVPFPFSDTSGAKYRPALVLMEGDRNDLVLAAISSSSDDANGVSLKESDFMEGKLSKDSVIRPSTLFTFDRAMIERTAGTITREKHREVVDRIVTLLG
jgi:mRNA interferase MazF